MENEPEKTADRSYAVDIKKCFALHCKHNCGGKCELDSTYILVNGMCDSFAIRSRGDAKCS